MGARRHSNRPSRGRCTFDHFQGDITHRRPPPPAHVAQVQVGLFFAPLEARLDQSLGAFPSITKLAGGIRSEASPVSYP